MEENEQPKKSGIGKLLEFYKNHRILCNIILVSAGSFIGIVLLVVMVSSIFQPIFDSFSLFFGVKSEDLLSDSKYGSYTLEDLQKDETKGNWTGFACYKGMTREDGFLGTFKAAWKKVKDSLTPGLNSACEVVNTIYNLKDEYEEKYATEFKDMDENEYPKENIGLSPGIIVSTIAYTYKYQTVVDGNLTADDSKVSAIDPINILEDLVESQNIVLTEDMLREMMDNMILKRGFWKYECSPLSAGDYVDSCANNSNADKENIRKYRSASAAISEFERGLKPKGYSSIDSAKSAKKEAEDALAPALKLTGKCLDNSSFYYGAAYSAKKYALYLKYGPKIAEYYEIVSNYEDSRTYSCFLCMALATHTDDDNPLHLNGVLEGLDNEMLESVGISYSDYLNAFIKENYPKKVVEVMPVLEDGSYSYKDGFIYQNSPNYKKAFDAGEILESDKVLLDINNSIDNIFSYSDIVDEVLGEKEEKINQYCSIDNVVKKDSDNRSKGIWLSLLKITDLGTEGNHFMIECNGACGCQNRTLFGMNCTMSNDACNILNSTAIRIRLYDCMSEGITDEDGISHKYPLEHPSSSLPGGYHIGTSPTGNTTNIANNSISIKQYLLGSTFGEIGCSSNIEAIKAQFIANQTYFAYQILNDRKVGFNNAGELMVPSGTCFQFYSDPNYQSCMKNSDKYDDMYDDVKGKLMYNSKGEIVKASYKQSDSLRFQEWGNSMRYEDILIENGKYNEAFSDIKLRECRPQGLAGAAIDLMYDENGNCLNWQAFKNSFCPKYGDACYIEDSNTGWCAMFVSVAMRYAGYENYKQFRSTSVGGMLNAFANANRFYPTIHYGGYSVNQAVGQEPLVGDVIFFDNYANGGACGYNSRGELRKTDDCSRHVGIITQITGTTISYIHGATTQCHCPGGGTSVCISEIDKSSSQIIGYGRL